MHMKTQPLLHGGVEIVSMESEKSAMTHAEFVNLAMKEEAKFFPSDYSIEQKEDIFWNIIDSVETHYAIDNNTTTHKKI